MLRLQNEGYESNFFTYINKKIKSNTLELLFPDLFQESFEDWLTNFCNLDVNVMFFSP